MTNKIASTAVAPLNQKKVLKKKKKQHQQQKQKQCKSVKPEPQPLPAQTVETVQQKTIDNPVGRLQELSQNRLWPLPFYRFVCRNEDDPSRRQFTCTVQLCGQKVEGCGFSKKLAKRTAALAMLKLAEDYPESSQSQDLAMQLSVAPLDEDTFQELRSSKRLQSAARAGGEVGRLFSGVRNCKAGAILPPIEAPKDRSASDQLLELSRQHRFSLSFLDYSSDSDAPGASQRRAVVKLSTMPKIVAVGSGPNVGMAREQACRAAMEYLCSLTQQCTGFPSVVKKA